MSVAEPVSGLLTPQVTVITDPLGSTRPPKVGPALGGLVKPGETPPGVTRD